MVYVSARSWDKWEKGREKWLFLLLYAIRGSTEQKHRHHFKWKENIQ